VTLDVPAGAFALLTGASGSGKSTLLRAVCGLAPHFTGGHAWGLIRVGGLDPMGHGPEALGSTCGFVPGDPETGFVMDTVADEVAFALESRGLPRSVMRRRVVHALEQVGLRGFGERRIDTLSGGERQRVLIAAALALEPRFLVLDEPTSQLDDDCAAEVLDAVAHLAAERHLTVLLAEHRLERVAPRCDMVIHLPERAASPLVGPPDEILPLVPQPLAPRAPHTTHGPPRLQCKALKLAYGDTPVLQGVNLTVRAGEVVVVAGRSGSGKTTLLRIIAGLIVPDGGRVLIDGRPIVGRAVADICRGVGYLPQDPGALLFADTVADELLITLASRNASRNTLRASATSGKNTAPGTEPGAGFEGQVMATLESLGIADLAQRYPRDLSTGQRQRAALAAVTVTNPPLLLLDEPTRGLDTMAIADLATLLHRHAEAGRAVLVATHDRRLWRAAHSVLTLTGGKLRSGEPK
jgi:energy-coupling factor transport system ATP-binding protein